MSQLVTDIGPCEISWKGTVLGKTEENPDGGTQGGTILRENVETRESFRDHSGTQAFDSIVVGTRVEVEANLTGLDVSQLAAVVPGATIVDLPGGDKRLELRSAVGYSMRANAGELIMKPIESGVATTDESKWFSFPLAHPRPEFEIAFDIETQKVYKVMFMIFENLTSGIIAKIGEQVTT